MWQGTAPVGQYWKSSQTCPAVENMGKICQKEVAILRRSTRCCNFKLLGQEQLLGGMPMVVKHISSKNCLMSPSQLSGLYHSQNSLVNLWHHQNFWLRPLDLLVRNIEGQKKTQLTGMQVKMHGMVTEYEMKAIYYRILYTLKSSDQKICFQNEPNCSPKYQS